MTLVEFIENLKGLNDGCNYSEELLESLYNAIKNEPLECASVDLDDITFEDRVNLINGINNAAATIKSTAYVNNLRALDLNPFLQLPDPQTAKEYRFGWLLRKCCIESDGKKASFLKRSWKMLYASLRDMVLYLHKVRGLGLRNF
jgi:PH/SEC7 domain-containing protein